DNAYKLPDNTCDQSAGGTPGPNRIANPRRVPCRESTGTHLTVRIGRRERRPPSPFFDHAPATRLHRLFAPLRRVANHPGGAGVPAGHVRVPEALSPPLPDLARGALRRALARLL